MVVQTYADYCPISVGVEILGDRWTPLVIRELMVGASGFNEIHRGVPRMSRTLLTQRLRLLVKRGLVQREGAGRGHPSRYVLTPAGDAITPIVWAMGHWAAEWLFGDPRDEDLDGRMLMWRMHQFPVPSRLPAKRTVVHIRLTGLGGTEGWLDIRDREITVCQIDPGVHVDVALEADTRQMHRWLEGLVPFHRLLASGDARLSGPTRLTRAFPSWFDTSTFQEGLRRADLRRAESRRLSVASDAVPA